MYAHFFSVGHSRRTLEEFAGILVGAGVEMLADVRAFPRSRSNPAFNIEHLAGELDRRAIGYRHLRSLGGRRGEQPGVDPDLNALWRVRSFHRYADYALGAEFGAALDELVELGGRQRVAIMCSEAVWWRCHRRIIVDYLLARGLPVVHLLGDRRAQPATMTSGAQVRPDGNVIYPVS